MSINESDTAAIRRFLSEERLASLITLTGAATEAIRLHQDTLRVGSSLLNVIASVEIAIRNTVSDNLADHFGVPRWLTQTPNGFQWREIERKKIAAAVDGARRAEYAKLSQNEKGALDILAYPNGRPGGTSHLRRSKDRRTQIIVSEGKVVAELTLYFWKRLYGPDYDQTLWRETLKRIFPRKSLSRAEIAAQLEVIYQSRNRLAHHEPVLHRRFDDTVRAIRFVVSHLNERASCDTPLARLLDRDLTETE